jgi:predicted nuclease with TOPRIM domain
MVTREVFLSRANEYIKKELVFENGFIAKQSISADERLIDITLVGQKVSDERLIELSKKLEIYRMPNAKLIVHQTVIKELDETRLSKTLLTEVLNSTQQTFDVKNSQLTDLQNELAKLRAQQGKQNDYLQEQKKIFDELVAQYPQIEKLSIAKTNEYQTKPAAASTVLLLNLTSKKSLSREDRRKINAWLKVRTGVDQVKLSINMH